MISINSLKNFVLVNGVLFLLGFYQYKFTMYTENTLQNHLFFKFVLTLFLFITRNYALMNMIEYGTKNKPLIMIEHVNMPKEEYKHEFHVNVVTTTAVETITHLFIQQFHYNFHLQSQNIHWYTLYSIIRDDFVYFIPYSFIFEIVFDFFHYLAHRLLHHKNIYKYL
jgi:hypothetical protein